MTSKELLNIWRNLPPLKTAGYAREIGLDPQNRQLIDELEAGDYEAQYFAAETIAGSHDMDRALRLCRKGYPAAKRTAENFLENHGTPTQLKTLFSYPNYQPDKSFVRLLIKKQRLETMELLFDALPVGTYYWWKLAGYNAPEKVQSCIQANYPKFLEEGETDTWNKLGIYHPQFIFEKLVERAIVPELHKAVVLGKQALMWMGFIRNPYKFLVVQALSALNGIKLWQPEKAIELVNALLSYPALSEEEAAQLHAFKAETLAFSVQNLREEIIPKLSRNLSDSQRERIIQLVKHNPDAFGEPIDWLRRLPPSFRGELWTEFGHRWRDRDDVVDIELLCLLPKGTRKGEAVYHLGLTALASDPERWLPYAALLDFEDARQKIQEFLQDPNPNVRAAAYRALLLSVRFSRSHLTEVLSIVGIDDDEFVQAAIAQGLAALPLSVWNETHLERLEKLLKQILSRQERSEETSLFLESFCVALLPRFPIWAIYKLDAVMKGRQYSWHWNLEARLRDSDMLLVGPKLLPVVSIWVYRNPALLLNVLWSFGHRLKAWDEGSQLLVELVRFGSPPDARTAIDILSKYRRDIDFRKTD